MEELDYDKLLEELMEARQSRITSVRPSGTVGPLISGGSSGYVNYDFASLYPSTMSMRLGPRKNVRRKRKIKNIFPDIEE